jgi:N-acyl amino acid synthase of PEP-CTERM/exosortase system
MSSTVKIKKFRVVLAENEALKKSIYRLRYEVCVEEYGLESADRYPDGLLMDPYDFHSLHVAALGESGSVLGALRIILHSEAGFPIQHFVKMRPPDKMQKLGELSRMVIAPLFRRRVEDGFYGVESYLTPAEGGVLPEGKTGEGLKERRSPQLILGLFRGAYAVSKRLGLTYWFQVAEQKLVTALDKYGLPFTPLGPAVEYHGPRLPCQASLADIEKTMQSVNPALFTEFTAGLDSSPTHL